MRQTPLLPLSNKAVFSASIYSSHLATLSSSHCMHELKMQIALFIPVMTSYMLSMWQSVDLLFIHSFLLACYPSLVLFIDLVRGNISRPLVENTHKIFLIDTSHGTNRVVLFDERDSLFPIKPYRECIRFYDWLMRLDSSMFFLVYSEHDWLDKYLPPFEARKAPPPAPCTEPVTVKTCNILVQTGCCNKTKHLISVSVVTGLLPGRER